MLSCFLRHLLEFITILRIVHLLGMQLKPLDPLHLFDLPLAEKVEGVGRFIGSEIEKTAPPFRPVFTEGEAIITC